MKYISVLALALSMSALASAQDVQTFSYSTPDGKSGLRVAWRNDS